MDRQRLFKTEPSVCPPQPQDGYFLSHSPFQVVPSTPNGAAQYPPLQVQNHPATLPVQSHQIGQPAQSPYMVVDNLQVRHPCALIVKEAGAVNPNSTLSLSASELDTKTQAGYTPMHVPSSSNSSGSELGRIVRPLTPTQQCRIQDNDMDHIGHMLMEVNAKDEVESGSVCALSAKTLYLSNSGAVISTIDLPYYWCNFCTFKTEQKIVLLKHTMSHRFWCKWCRYQSYNRADVIRHCISIHPQLSENDFKFCVLLPDFLHSKLVPDEKDDGDKKEDSTVNVVHSETAPAACEVGEEEEDNTEASSPTNTVSESVTNEVCEQSKRKHSGKFKKGPKKSSKRKGVDNSEKSETAKKTKQAKETENNLTDDCKPEKSFSVCFECCACHLRTLQKEIIERHQQEVNHYETDRTTGKKTYVLKIISTADKLKLHASDRKWLSEREETSGRTRRRSKVEALQFIKNKVEDDDNDAEWDLGNELDDDDDDDEDYVPTKGKKKGKNLWKKNSTQGGESNEKCIVSNVDIEIDTAAEPSSDTVVQSFSVSCLNVENTVKISPKKIVSRDLFDNSLIVEPHLLKPEVKQDMSHMKKVLFAGDKVRMPISAVSTNPVLATLVSATTSALSVPTASNLIKPRAVAPKSDSAVIIVSAEAPVPAVQTSVTVPLTAGASIIIDDAPPNPPSSKAGSSNPPSKSPKPASNSSKIVSKSSNSSVVPKTSSESPASGENLGLEEEEKLNETIVNKKGIFKCAHCRVVADRILQIRLHILEKHKENPLYCLDMETIDGVSPRYMLFCHFKNCKFFTRSRDNFLKHVDKCKFGKVNKLSKSEETFKEVNYNFVKSTYPKLMKITK
ncbi:uncharacterized protein LOC121376499 [Gigantopelta aegis]|uniref:uncharacterized protein LOC121376499 n=1 Tax=Gigantopelta aegis TaxID=1735272 RepID=UPI001B88C4EC|nr:uncharacterized protein LOC121376499 [Gigantopelta aegis]